MLCITRCTYEADANHIETADDLDDLVQDKRATLFNLTYVRSYGCWKPGQFGFHPLTNAARGLIDACRLVSQISMKERVVAARHAIAKGVHVNALYQLPIGQGRVTEGGFSPLRMAAFNCFLPVVRELLVAGADPNMTSSDGTMPLDIMPKESRKVGRKVEIDGVGIVDMLIRAGASEMQRTNAINRIRAVTFAPQRLYLSPILRALVRHALTPRTRLRPTAHSPSMPSHP